MFLNFWYSYIISVLDKERPIQTTYLSKVERCALSPVVVVAVHVEDLLAIDR